MGNARLLVVEDDVDISNMLRIFFTSKGYDVDVAPTGEIALLKTRQVMPHLIVLDIMLPDTTGYEVCRTLRTNNRTSHIPVIFLTQRDERSDKLQGLELGVDDYITKPFDIEELRLRVQNAIARAERDSLTDPQTGLPAGKLIEDQLRRIMQLENWSFMDVRIRYFEGFKNVYGFIAANEVLRHTAILLGELVDRFGSQDDFIGHAGGDNFVLVSTPGGAVKIANALKARFSEEICTHYSFLDRQQGYIQVEVESGVFRQEPFMVPCVGVVSPGTHVFADIRENTELAAEERRKDHSS